MKNFLLKKDIQISAKRYFIDAMGAMAYGLFATLLVGTILKTIGEELDISFLTDIVWPVANQATGPAIALAIAYSLRAPQLVLFSSAVIGIAAYQLGGPLGVFIATIVAVEVGKMVAGETRIDIVITPIITVLVGVILAQIIGPSVQQMMKWIGEIIIFSTDSNPLIMGVVIAVIVGMVLTLPISSAALCLMLELDGSAAGAATIGCCAQMIGFATISFKDNGLKGVLAQGLGTSMLQVPNIYKNWKIWIPPTLASAIIGPIAIIYFNMENTALESGMGSCGLVGQIGTFNAMKSKYDTSYILTSILILQIIAPAIISYLIYIFMKKKNWIKDGDMKLR
ncbi:MULTISPECIES: PTS transporter subunit IIC [Empedobacter]|uniref:PTS sugar transporter subunit IIC n=1 Tax=Empedobacter falsenii TaxID=343874 RepID=A0A427BJQ4_9FLAO|nr:MULTISPECIES: PTS sugar transporter subunit IIC [Empedobacter]MDH0659435.1 PTS sugar transporter subunit IIC [Empedobacter sp. GD03865]MDH0675068.1 PTS sugar transporter subunit IIC [Empedobacter sp. GD03861]MDH1603295.1 PTS sugar transporter subunit IIC [Empedobacter sp. GD03739]RRT88732.1 PTS sugar transporter subunit IIC [Empedobacter falsenii]RRT89606.1 PTS sugar transporter subunit IIC [Empedobacter falsenii]